MLSPNIKLVESWSTGNLLKKRQSLFFRIFNFLPSTRNRSQILHVQLGLNSLISSNVNLPAKERVLQTFEEMLKIMNSYPFLARVDMGTIKLISRRVSKERLSEFYMQNDDAAILMQSHGIKFNCDIETASCLFQTLYHSWMYLSDKGADMQKAVTDILLNGAIGHIVVL